MLKDRIEKIIEVKERQMEDKEREIEGEKTRLETINKELQVTGDDIDRNYDKLTAKGMMGNDFTVITDYLDYLENTRQTLNDEKELIHEKIVFLKDELVGLMKEMKMLETLRTKVMNELKKSANRREQKLLDDIALRIEEKKC